MHFNSFCLWHVGNGFVLIPSDWWLLSENRISLSKIERLCCQVCHTCSPWEFLAVNLTAILIAPQRDILFSIREGLLACLPTISFLSSISTKPLVGFERSAYDYSIISDITGLEIQNIQIIWQGFFRHTIEFYVLILHILLFHGRMWNWNMGYFMHLKF